MLNFSVTDESNSGLVGLSPEFSVGKSQWVIVSNDGVELLGKDLKVSLMVSRYERISIY